MRTFIALPIPPASQAELETIQTELRSSGADVRWTAVGSIHLTLKFLGEVDPALIPSCGEALRRSAGGSGRLTLTLRGLGAFPNLHNPRVVWCGIQGDTEALLALQIKIASLCAAMGFPPEERPFQPHLTLGRIRSRTNLQRLVEYIKIGSRLESTFVANCINIYRSVLTPRGSLYSILETIELGK
jgi:2'-5' RNA ligase